MGKLIDLTGKRFGRLLVIERAEDHIQPSGQKKVQWFCGCDCGKEVVVLGSNLRRGATKSCGCLQKERAREANSIDLTGKRFGRLVVRKKVGQTKLRQSLWLCGCDCGRKSVVQIGNLTNGHTMSCGCYKIENFREAMKKVDRTGAKNPCWRGGRTSVATKIRNCDRYLETVYLCLERDNFTCLVSGQVGGNLHTHHIKPFSKILHENEITSLEDALDCKEMWSLDNLVTLSEKWHMGVLEENPLAFHRQYTWNNFSAQDFNTWVSCVKTAEV